ncbi:hypothetical protein [Pseudomonas siliginis]|uniref:hypothetical protein n=1 Tax=Pseudomonas siliginis TaxID=2842346 RepID=UPI002092C213|nr:hypothetical protein [Pseudomonas siliginis]UST97757.1 hypothetical protein NF679_11835 [Pseudomonas siliginis]
MSKYSELVQKFLVAKSSDAAYWEDLKDTAIKVARGFTSYLEAPTGNTVEIGGVKAPVVALGAQDAGNFLIRSTNQWERTGRSLEFALRLTFDAGHSTNPANFVVFSMVLSRDSKGYSLRVDDCDAVIFSQSSYTPVFEVLMARAVTHLESVH